MPPSPPPILGSQATRDWLRSELVMEGLTERLVTRPTRVELTVFELVGQGGDVLAGDRPDLGTPGTGQPGQVHRRGGQ
jgi:hypothetical protein